jgi:hypothetical protein
MHRVAGEEIMLHELHPPFQDSLGALFRPYLMLGQLHILSAILNDKFQERVSLTQLNHEATWSQNWISTNRRK